MLKNGKVIKKTRKTLTVDFVRVDKEESEELFENKYLYDNVLGNSCCRAWGNLYPQLDKKEEE